jgi:hypothetical protein
MSWGFTMLEGATAAWLETGGWIIRSLVLYRLLLAPRGTSFLLLWYYKHPLVAERQYIAIP